MWEKHIFIARRGGTETDENENVTVLYEEPIELYWNVQPASGNTAVLAYGERVSRMQRAIVPLLEWQGVFEEGDLAYLDGRTPEGETVNGEFANYRIISVQEQNLRIAISFEKLQKGVPT